MNKFKEQYAMYSTGGDDWCVFDTLSKTEVCICNSYETEKIPAAARAQTVCEALNLKLGTLS